VRKLFQSPVRSGLEQVQRPADSDLSNQAWQATNG
jgi:hypothetical protein